VETKVYVTLKGYDKHYAEWWWLPNQVLLRPAAFAADAILVLPVYVPVVLYALRDIGN
jgi:hypothetical protein